MLYNIFDRPLFNKDGTIADGFTVKKNRKGEDELTVWQVITRPEDLIISIRIPEITEWVEVDLEKIF